MGWTSIAMSMPPETTPVRGATCETDAIGKMSPGGSTLRAAVETEFCDCPNCRSVFGATRRRNVSPIASIDVCSLPDESDILHAPDRSN